MHSFKYFKALLLLLILSSFCMGRIVNITQKPNRITALTLSAPQTHFVRKKDTFYKQYVPVQSSIKVMATYKDGHSEEVTDKVEWIGVSDGILLDSDYFRADKGTYVLKASLQGIESNEITIDVKDDTSLVQYKASYPKEDNLIDLTVTLLNKPTQEVKLTLKLRTEDKVGFASHVNHGMKQSYTMTFRPEEWDKMGNTKDVQITILDTTLLEDIVVTTEPLVSDDINYSDKNPKDITLARRPALILDIPSLQSRKGAIRGVPIKFWITTGEQYWSKVTLVNYPNGMRVIGKVSIENTKLYGIEVQWDIPMDAIEGKIYNITAKATDPKGREKTITFPIKVPKTTPVPTKLVNNELIVTDKNSLLYGMKMKGHNGEDISVVKLRYVAYDDIQEHPSNQYEVDHKLKYTAFIIDNKPPQLDIDLPDILYFGFYRYIVGYVMYTGDPWEDIAREYDIHADGSYVLSPRRNEHDNGGNKVYLLVVEDKGL
ncbi:hypothetical protein C9926_00530 [Sulfurovum lithotrophicum]|nr:hypothetical protein C9926_00530 [Sulfurovum lithotrophicum]